jgi:hypothetical protein
LKKDELSKVDLVMGNAYIDAVTCGVGVVKLTLVAGGGVEMDSVPTEEFFDLSEELRWRAANMQKDDS